MDVDSLIACEWSILVLGILIALINLIFGGMTLVYSIMKVATDKRLDGKELWILLVAFLSLTNCVRVLELCPIINICISDELRFGALRLICGIVLFVLGVMITWLDVNFIRRIIGGIR